MESTAILWVFFTANLCVAAGRNHIVECEEDHECGENNFCYRTGMCALCTNCAVYSRKPHEYKSCAKFPSECGECFSGYVADTLTDGTSRDLCMPIKSTTNSVNIPDGPGQISVWLYGVFLVGVPVLILIVVLLLYLKTSVRHQTNRAEVLKSEQPLPVIMRPPPYFNCGESPLLRNTGGAQCQCEAAWNPEHELDSSIYQNKECDIKFHTTEKAADGFQQAMPFEYNPEESSQRTPSRTRTSCRPDEQTDRYDKDDDNEDQLSISPETEDNELNSWSVGFPRNTEQILVCNHTAEAAAGGGNCVLKGRDCDTSLKRRAESSDLMFERNNLLCDTASRPDHSTYSLCSQTDAECRCHQHLNPIKCSSEKNMLKDICLTSKCDSGFVSSSSSRCEVLKADASFSGGRKETQDLPFFQVEQQINICFPVSVNVSNTVNVCH